VIGVLSTRQAQAEGVAFAIKSKNIYQLVEDLKIKDTSMGNQTFKRGFFKGHGKNTTDRQGGRLRVLCKIV
jgi:hypothetical protein